METNVNYTLVGAFVIALILVIACSIIYLSSGFSFARYTTYAVYMTEPVAGLNIDSLVEFNGVSVGSVNEIDINPLKPQVVKLLINVRSDTPITQGTKAMIAARGFTGISYVALKDTGKNIKPLKALRGQKYAVIPASPSLFVRIDTTLSILTENFHNIAESIQKLLSPDNQESIKDILLNMKSITHELAINNKRMSLILRNTEQVSAEFSPLIRSGTNVMRTFESQTLPAAYEVLNNFNNITQQLSNVASQLKQNPSVLIRGTQPSVLGPGEK